ncbi:hypothetical protein AKJ51_04530 [candidate division MSBL1 archaeon SCGC-AAA382A20]|uniref:50S ribosomal protein L6 n=1 Tax=candidate division MSBL1 archaeon SCGC-AAA382A20 TaxID=1698280 RepID=A0A133VHI3_9EURY|nr:hypothetical protein AKJ51_04530 [candidate division MSBL1 archaeon SCGC-AAA382A20]
MKKEIEIPDGIEGEVEGEMVKLKKGDEKVKKKFKHPLVDVSMDGNKLVIRGKKDNKKVKSVVQTFESKVKNAISGLEENYEYKLKIVYRHFPMDVKAGDGYVEVTNFVGEKSKRTAKILEDVDVGVKDEEIIVRGPDKEKVGQTAANIEQKIQAPSTRDRRVFEDGIYIVEKPKR